MYKFIDFQMKNIKIYLNLTYLFNMSNDSLV